MEEDDSYPIPDIRNPEPLDIDRYKIPYGEYCMFCTTPKDICYMHQIGDTIFAFISCSSDECNISALHHVEAFQAAWALDKQ